MYSITKKIINLIPLVLIVGGLVSYNLMSAQWQAPTATAPNNNTEAPINISANYQAKLGDLGAVRMRAGQYCNADGTICFTSPNGSAGTVYKICSAFVVANWRDTITVPATWTNTSCQSFMTAIGATGYAFGCIADSKFYLYDDPICDNATEPMPSRKFCSVVAASGNWRDTVLVPSGFTDTQCASLQTTTGAASRQMGCLTDTGVVLGNTAGCNTGGSTNSTDLRVCSVALSGNWRDTFNVPSAWDVSICSSYGISIGVTGNTAGYGLGCALPTGVTFGSTRSCS